MFRKVTAEMRYYPGLSISLIGFSFRLLDVLIVGVFLGRESSFSREKNIRLWFEPLFATSSRNVRGEKNLKGKFLALGKKKLKLARNNLEISPEKLALDE